jgi:hypothetical protein
LAVLLVAAVIIGAAAIIQNISLRAAVEKAEMAYAMLRQEAAAARAEHQKEIEALHAREAELMGMIDSTHIVIAELEVKEEAARKRIEAMRLDFTKVDAECRRALVALDLAWE